MSITKPGARSRSAKAITIANKLDPCEAINASENLEPAVASYVKTALAGAVTQALAVEKKQRCCKMGKDGLWIQLPPEVLKAIADEALRLHQDAWRAKGGKGTPPPVLRLTLT